MKKQKTTTKKYYQIKGGYLVALNTSLAYDQLVLVGKAPSCLEFCETYGIDADTLDKLNNEQHKTFIDLWSAHEKFTVLKFYDIVEIG